MLFSRTDPFQALFDLQRAMDTRQRSNWLRSSTSGRGAYPPINVFQKGDDFIAVIEIPGVSKDNLDIQAKDNVIRLSGVKAESFPEGVSTHRRERVFGTFDRTISVPVRIDAEKIKAEYNDGILALFIPRLEDDKPRRVKIG
jgi:HSP20 family protein